MAITNPELLRLTTPRELMTYAAEDVGRALGKGDCSAESLRELRRLISWAHTPPRARTTLAEERGFRYGLLVAIDHVLAGYLAEHHSARRTVANSCPACAAVMVYETRKETAEYRGREVSADVAAWWCTQCPEAVFEGEALQALESAVERLHIRGET